MNDVDIAANATTPLRRSPAAVSLKNDSNRGAISCRRLGTGRGRPCPFSSSMTRLRIASTIA